MESYGGGYKINLLRDALEPYKDDADKLILFTDRYRIHMFPLSNIIYSVYFSTISSLFSFIFCHPNFETRHCKLIFSVCYLVVMMCYSQPISMSSCTSSRNSKPVSYSVLKNLSGQIRHWSISIQRLPNTCRNISIRAYSWAMHPICMNY